MSYPPSKSRLVSLIRWLSRGVACAALGIATSATAQQAAAPADAKAASPPAGAPAASAPAAATPTAPAPGKPAESPERKPDEKPAERTENKAGESPKKPEVPSGKPGEPGAKPGEPGSGENPPPIQRPTAPPKPPNPEELGARPDSQGKVRFNFRGQPWSEVLSWLAEISHQSLDWQELPGDFLNLTTQRTYTVPEARDLLNRHLLARGFTLLENGEILNVVNLKKLDPGMVPRIEPRELAERQPHDFVRVSFPLDWLVAESAVEELKPMLSPFGKLTSLKTTNRLEALDAVINLRSIYRVIGQEQGTEGQERVVREFELEHAKAADVAQQLTKLMGVEEKSSQSMMGGRGMSPEQMEQIMRQQAEMMAREGREGRGMPMMSKPKVEINIVLNARRNSVLVLAPPDKMAIVSQAVKLLDVPSDRSATIAGALQRIQVYRLASLDPGALAKMLDESGSLDPTTKVQADDKNKALIVHGSLADQFAIRGVIEKLDGASRKFQVVPLRRLEADYVAGTIEFMMGGAPEEPSNNSRRGYFDFMDAMRRGQSSQDKDRDKFRVDADVENNRLLLWANEIEIGEVMNLLKKLGEVADPQEGSNLRVIPVPEGTDPRELLEQLRRAWPSLAPNPLESSGTPAVGPRGERTGATPNSTGDELPARDAATPRIRSDKSAPPSSTPNASPKASPASDTPATESTPATPPASDAQPARRAAQRTPTTLTIARAEELAVATQPIADAPPAAQSAAEAAAAAAPVVPERNDPNSSRPSAAPPVRMGVTPDGRLILSSSDPQALNLLEEMIRQLTLAERKDYHVFHLKHSQAYWVRMTIEKYFEEEDKEKSPRGRNVFFFDSAPPAKTEPRHRLSKRRKLKFISDPDTNTILVTGADPSQLRVIEDLIELYDQPLAGDSKAARSTTIYAVRYATASSLAETLKEVYRDLLSANDKALSSERRPQNQTTYIFGESGDGEEKRTPVTFKGKLSIGVDDETNTLILSVEGETLMQNVLAMVRSLDEAAKPLGTMHVLQLNGSVNANSVQRALDDLLGDGSGSSSSGNSSNRSQRSPSNRGSQNSNRRSR